jgi:hypothetical protein
VGIFVERMHGASDGTKEKLKHGKPKQSGNTSAIFSKKRYYCIYSATTLSLHYKRNKQVFARIAQKNKKNEIPYING